MRRRLGQATILSAIVSHRILSVMFGFGVLCLLLLTGLVWRLAQGPVALDFLTTRIEAALNSAGSPTRISIGGIALAWEGFHDGLDRPVDLRLRDVQLVDETGRKRLTVPKAAIVLSPRGLLLGRLLPSVIEMEGVRLTLLRGPDGSLSVDMGSLSEAMDAPPADGESPGEMVAELLRPLSDDTSGQGQGLSLLRHVRLDDIGIVVRDAQLGATWTVAHLNVDLVRQKSGEIAVTGGADLALGDQTAHVTLSVAAPRSKANLVAHVAVAPFVPAALARAAPGLAALAALDAPLSAQADISVSSSLAPLDGALSLNIGPGTAHTGEGTAVLRAAEVHLRSTADQALSGTAGLILPGEEGRPDTTVTASGSAQRGPRLTAAVSLGLDRVTLADLPRFWPKGVARGARAWVLDNISSGILHDGHADIAIEANPDLTGAVATKAVATLEGDEVTVHWLRPVPPVEQARAHLHLLGPDALEITFLGGRQRVGGQLPLALTGGMMRITGLSVKDQDAEIAVQVTGGFADTVTLLKDPRLKLLSAHPIDLREPAGDVAAAVKVKLPLENKLAIEDVEIGVTAQLRRGHLTGIAAGRDLDQADLEIVADTRSLTLKGTGQLGGIAAKIDGLMDFQGGKPKDVQQRITVTAKPSVAQLATAGLDARDGLAGDLPIQAVWSKRVDGDADIVVSADLTGTELIVAPLAWHKPPGVSASGSLRLVIAKDRLASIGPIVVDGAGLVLRASADMAGREIATVHVDRAVFGHNELSGTIHLPPRGPIGVELNGQSLDVAAKVMAKTPARDRSKPEPPPGSAWTLTGSFGRVGLAHDKTASHVRADAGFDGRVFQSLAITGETGANAPFNLNIRKDGERRRLDMRAADAGAFLAGVDVTHSMESGTLIVSGTFDDAIATHPLNGTAEITDFRVRGAPALGKLLQAMTLYGLVDVIRGAGLGFARLTAPFVLGDDLLTLNDATAFSPSLGMTAKGRLDLSAETIDLEGTVVPAYFFNSLLGKIPFVGGLFRDEKGGGLLAARYTLRGPTGDPAVFVNPLSVLTPGFLRGVFRVF